MVSLVGSAGTGLSNELWLDISCRVCLNRSWFGAFFFVSEWLIHNFNEPLDWPVWPSCLRRKLSCRFEKVGKKSKGIPVEVCGWIV